MRAVATLRSLKSESFNPEATVPKIVPTVRLDEFSCE